MYRLPLEIRIGPHRYTLMREAQVESRQRWGETDSNLREIRFGTLAHPRQLSVTALHELMHAVWAVYGDATLSDSQEEHTIAAMSTGLAQVMQDLGLWPEEIKLAGED